MFGAMILGYALRNIGIIQKVHKLITPTIAVLLLLLGIGVGSNKTILENLSQLGVQALILAALGVLGSSLAAWATYHWFFKGKKQTLKNLDK